METDNDDQITMLSNAWKYQKMLSISFDENCWVFWKSKENLKSLKGSGSKSEGFDKTKKAVSRQLVLACKA